jgi:hypothetical protein
MPRSHSHVRKCERKCEVKQFKKAQRSVSLASERFLADSIKEYERLGIASPAWLSDRGPDEGRLTICFSVERRRGSAVDAKCTNHVHPQKLPERCAEH